MKRRARTILLLGIPLAVADLFFIFFLASYHGGIMFPWLIRVPANRDPRLVGTWHGTWVTSFDKTLRVRTTTFNADGTGRFSQAGGNPPFDWGTENGVLYTRRMATDAWSGRRIPYAISSNGRIAHFSDLRTFDLVVSEMHK